jgi:hypothetical protein
MGKNLDVILLHDLVEWKIKGKGKIYVGTSLKFGGNLVRNKKVWTNKWKCEFDKVQYISVTLEGQ